MNTENQNYRYRRLVPAPEDTRELPITEDQESIRRISETIVGLISSKSRFGNKAEFLGKSLFVGREALIICTFNDYGTYIKESEHRDKTDLKIVEFSDFISTGYGIMDITRIYQDIKTGEYKFLRKEISATFDEIPGLGLFSNNGSGQINIHEYGRNIITPENATIALDRINDWQYITPSSTDMNDGIRLLLELQTKRNAYSQQGSLKPQL